MSEMKLIYFNSRGRAEMTRMLFKLAGKPFEDCRLSKEQWLELKPNTPKGQLPVLEVDGKMICESMAIARYVARETGLYGANNFESAEIDMLLDSILEVFGVFIQHGMKAKTDEEKAEASKHIKPYIENFEKFVATQKKGEFILGDKASLADVSVHSLVDVGKFFSPTLIVKEEVPTLMEIAASFEKIPAIAEWIKARPETEF